MSRTVVLSGIDGETPHVELASLIRAHRSADPSLSRYDHDVLCGIENELLNGVEPDQIGFVGTAAAVGGVAARVAKGIAGRIAESRAKRGALKKAGGLFSKIRGGIKARIEKRKASGKVSPVEAMKEAALLQLTTNLQAKTQEASAQEATKELAAQTGFGAGSVVSPAAMAVQSYAPQMETPAAGGLDLKNPVVLAALAIGAALIFKGKK